MPHQLPAQLTAFIGRDEEKMRLQQLLEEPGNRLITVLGPGGVGKTRLALAAAEDQLARLGAEVYFVSLLAVTSWEQMALVLASTIGFTLYGDQPPEEQLFTCLRDKARLVVLDNLEHLVEGAEFINRLLQAAQRLQLLATSREKLNLLSETVFTVDGFQIDDWPDLEAAFASDAVALFLQSARRVKAAFTLTESDLPGLARIGRITGGMPLALELAAAWVDVLSVDEIAAEIERNYEFLTAQFRDMPARHRSLRATFDSSWERLSAPEQEMLRRMSVFQGAFTRAAAQAVTGAGMGDLQSLVTKSLLKLRETRFYEIHELLRQYLSASLDQSGGMKPTQADWSRYYLNWLRECEPGLKGAGQLQALNAIEAEFANVRAVWLYAGSHDPSLFYQAAESLFLYLMMRNRYQEGEGLFRRAEDVLSVTGGSAAAAARTRMALYRIWLVRWREGTFTPQPDAFAQIKTFRAAFEQSSTPRDMAVYLMMLGAASIDFESEREQVEGLLQDSLRRLEALGDRYYTGWTLHFLASHAQTTHGLPAAIDLQTRSLELRRSGGDLSGEVYSLYNLSLHWLQMGNLDACITLAGQMLERAREIGERSGQLMAGTLQGIAALLRGELDDADAIASRTLRLAADLNHPLGKRYAIMLQGLTAVVRGDDAAGLRVLADVQREPFPENLAYFVHLALAMALIDAPDAQAQAALGRAAHYALAVQGTGLIAWCLPVYAVLAASHGDNPRAVTLLTAASPLCAALDRWPPLVRVRAGLAHAIADSAQEPAAALRSLADLLTQAASGDKDRIPFRVRDANRALIEPLSDRELEILTLIVHGLPNADIAERLFIGISTVKKHISHIYGKLDVTTRDEAVLRARERGLV